MNERIIEFLFYWTLTLAEYFSPLSHLFSAILGGLFVAVVGPRLRLWAEVRNRRQERRRGKILRRAKYLEDDLKSKIDPLRIKKFRKWLAGQFTKLVIMPIAIIFCLILFAVYFVNYIEALHREDISNLVQEFDKSKDRLFLKTIRNSSNYEEKEEVAILQQELICNLTTLIESEKIRSHESRKIVLSVNIYKSCMLQAGWLAEPCVQGECNCEKVAFSESFCMSEIRAWLKNGKNDRLVRQCMKSNYNSLFPN